MLKFRFYLQLFADGGDGGSGATDGATGEVAETTGDEELSRIPERARDMYKRAAAKHKPTVATNTVSQPQEEAENKPTHISYADLIKSDEYKDEHKAYMDKTISDRLKKYKGIEESNKKMSDALNIVANKYGLDTSAADFMDQLTSKISSDDSFYEQYAMDHDISTDDAKEILTLKNQVAQQKLEEQRRAEAEAQLQREEQQRAAIDALRANAEKTKAMYPSFDLDAEMNGDPRFKVICATTNGDTTAAYWAVHHNDLMRAQGQVLQQQAAQQAANTVAANKARPIENGLSSQASSVTVTDWSKADLKTIRAQAAEWRRGH